MRKMLMLTLVVVAAAVAPVLADAMCSMKSGCSEPSATCGRTFEPGVAVSGASDCTTCCGATQNLAATVKPTAAAPAKPASRLVASKSGFRPVAAAAAFQPELGMGGHPGH